MTLKVITGAACLMLATNVALAAKPSSDKDKLSYTLGVQVGEQYKANGIEINTKVFAEAVKDTLSGKTPSLTREEMIQAIQKLQQEQVNRMKKIAGDNLKKGRDFLAKNKKKKGVVALPSGVQYIEQSKGKGKRPTADNNVVAHYRGTLIDGSEFDSSIARGQPATFPVSGVIRGWQEVLQLMQVGAKWKVFIPAELAYGERGAPPNIGPNETLIFDIELIDIK